MATEVIVTDEFSSWYDDLSHAEQDAVTRVVSLLEVYGTELRYPYSSAIQGSRFALRELRVQHAGDPYRILYAFDPLRQAVLLVGGVKTSIGNRWYGEAIRKAERALKDYLANIGKST